MSKGPQIKKTIPSYYDYSQALTNYKSLANQAKGESDKTLKYQWDAAAPLAQVGAKAAAAKSAEAYLASLLQGVLSAAGKYNAATALVCGDVAAYIAALASQPPAQIAPNAKPAPLPKYEFPDDIDKAEIKVVNANPGGTTGAQIVEIKGRKYILKTDKNVDRAHVENEAAADQIYRAAGVAVPDCKLYRKKDGTTVKLSQFIEGGTSLKKYMATATPAQKEAVRKQLAKGYLLDVALENWDVLGTDQDNVLIDKDGRAWRIDNGSAMGFRAQGAKKKPEEWDKRDNADAWRTLRESPINKGVFDTMTAHDIFSSQVDLDAAYNAMPAAERTKAKAVFDELKKMQTRCRDYDATGYQPSTTSSVLEKAYDFDRSRVAEDIPAKVSHGNYGFLRESQSNTFGGVTTGGTPGAKDYANAIKQAAISINKHCGYGSNPSTDTDNAPNMGTVNAALACKKDLEAFAAKGSQEAKTLLGFIQDIETAQAQGWQKVKKIANVPNLSVASPVAQVNGKKQYVSITDALYDLAENAAAVDAEGRPIFDPVTGKQKRERLDVERIAEMFKGQGGNSWSERATDLKVLQLNATGRDWKTETDKGVWYGKGAEAFRQENYHNSRDKYAADPALLEADSKALDMWRAATMQVLEKSDFPGNDHATRTVRIIRTDDAVRYNSPVGTVGPAYPMGPCESGSIAQSVQVDGNTVGVREVPYTRIYTCYYMDARPTRVGFGQTMFFGDGEREIGADMTGLDVYHGPTVSHARSYELEQHKTELDKAFGHTT